MYNKLDFRNEIVGLRGIAVISVIFFHLNYSYFKGGFLGVDIFFVVSGYLITSIIFKNLENLNLFDFYVRRARRILPVFVFVLFATIPLSYFLLMPDNFKDYGQSLIAAPLFLSNYLFWIEEGYWELSSQMKPLLHTWSLAVEAQFYLFFPFIFLVKRKYVLLIIIILLIISLIVSINDNNKLLLITTDKVLSLSSFYLPFARFWEFLAGSLIFFFEKRIIFKKSIINNLLSLIGLIIIFWSIFNIKYSSEFPNLITLLPVIGTMLLIIYIQKNFIIYKVLNSKILYHLGELSYSLYLWHFPIIVFKKFITNLEFNIYADIIVIFCAYILSLFSFKYIEKPFYKKNYLKTKNFIIMILLLSIFLISMGFIINYNEKSAFIEKKLSKLKKNFPRYEEYFGGGSLKYKYGATNIDLSFSGEKNLKKILVLGDSHGRDMVRVFKRYNHLLSKEGSVLENDFSFLEFSTLKFDKKSKLYNELKSVDFILLSRQFTSEKNQLNKIIDLIKFSKTNDIKFGIIGSAPEFYTSEDDLLLTFLLQNDENLKHFTNKDYKKINYYFFSNLKTYLINTNNTLRKISKQYDVIFLDRFDFTCELNQYFCFGIDNNGNKLFMDYSHFTSDGINFFARKIKAKNWLYKLN
tara:strand:- start:52 stop:1962 length:1911 start_codon:yes stop_codon:yes gene_type:complete